MMIRDNSIATGMAAYPLSKASNGTTLPLYSPNNDRRVAAYSARSARCLLLAKFLDCCFNGCELSSKVGELVALLLHNIGGRFVDEAFVGEFAVDRSDLFGEIVTVLFQPLAFGADVNEAAHVDVNFNRAMLPGKRAAGGLI